jgi:hypothetical protein
MSCIKTLLPSSGRLEKSRVMEKMESKGRFPLSHNPGYGYGLEPVDVAYTRG